MNALYSYLIEPTAPLVFRSGKPFGVQSYNDVNFPMPSSAAGLVRSMYADQNIQKFPTFSAEAATLLKGYRSRGPFLVRYSDKSALTVLVPKPADAIYLQHKTSEQTQIVRLVPKAFDEDCSSDLPDGLLPVQMEEYLKGKPESGAQFWTLEQLIDWQNGKKLSFDEVSTDGLDSLPVETRSHVAIDDESLASSDGRLFQTAGFDLQPKAQAKHQGWQSTRLGFLTQADVELQNDLATFGGERRLSYLKSLGNQDDWMVINQDLSTQLQNAKGLRLTLLTPAIFAKGHLPAWIDQVSLEGVIPQSNGLRVKLKATAIERWLPVSGWDLQLWKPKVMRKAVAAGAVYWFEIIGAVPEQVHKQLWLAAISDDVQDKCDGFGLVLPAAWTPV